jgi:hypothetical protein
MVMMPVLLAVVAHGRDAAVVLAGLSAWWIVVGQGGGGHGRQESRAQGGYQDTLHSRIL